MFCAWVGSVLFNFSFPILSNPWSCLITAFMNALVSLESSPLFLLFFRPVKMGSTGFWFPPRRVSGTG